MSLTHTASASSDNRVILQLKSITEFANSLAQRIEYWIEQGLTSHETHYRSDRGWVFTRQMT